MLARVQVGDELPSGLKSLLECFWLFQNVSLGVKASEHQLACVVRMDGIEEIFDREDRSFEEPLPLGSSHGDEEAFPFSTFLRQGELFQEIFFHPEGLASVDQRLGPSRDSIEEDGRCQDKDIRLQQFGKDVQHVVLNDALTRQITPMALATGGDVKIGETEAVHPRSSLFRSLEGFLQQTFGVSILSWTPKNSKNSYGCCQSIPLSPNEGQGTASSSLNPSSWG